MDIVDVVAFALAGTEANRIDASALEPAEVATEGVAGLAEILHELVDNGLENSPLGELVRVAGFFEQGSYLISVSDRGIGMSEDRINELNRVLDGRASGLATLGLPLVARLARRHGIVVQLVSGVPGVTARVVIPPSLVTPIVPDKPQPPSGTLPPAEPRAVTGDEPILDTEAFLESIFGPLLHDGVVARPEAPSGNGSSGHGDMPPADPGRRRSAPGPATALRVRIPGESFDESEDLPSTAPGEGAVDIRIALSRYDEGRQRSTEDRP